MSTPQNNPPSAPPAKRTTHSTYTIHQRFDLRLAPFQSPTIVGASFLDTRIARAFRRPAAVILALPCSGRAWLGAILAYALAETLPNALADLPAKPLDIDSWTATDTRLPRILATNGKVSPWRATPEEMPRDFHWLAHIPVIILTRDPRDIATSIIARRHTLRPASEGAAPSPELEAFISANRGGLATITAAQANWLAAAPRFARVHTITYEHLHTDPQLEIGRLLTFLKMPVSPERVEYLARAASFKSLRDAEDNARLGLRTPTNSNQRIFRRGIPGGFRDYMSLTTLNHAQHIIDRYATPNH